MFSVNDIYLKLKGFKAELAPDHPQLYFAKLDVQAAFDTIPQEAVVGLMACVPGQSEYTLMKHAEVKPGERTLRDASKPATNPITRWHGTAVTDAESSVFTDRLKNGLGVKKKNTVFVDATVRKTYKTGSLLHLLAQHVKQNLVKIGKKYYRQKTGIPQGSVLSSFLCNYFYADLEIRQLGFLCSPDCLLLRLIDDFLLITLDKAKAIRFVETMHRGMPDYGVEVNPKKTLVNFDMHIPEGKVSKVANGEGFPYCGTLIDTRTLEITKDRDRSKNIGMFLSEVLGFSTG
jgi:telomerase reverse transcriptase